MQLPKELGSLKDLQKREQKAHQKNDQWWSLLDDAYDYFLPQRNLFDEQESGQDKMDKIFDSTAIEAIQQGASKLQESIAPIWSTWAKFDITETLKEFLEENPDSGIDAETIRRSLERTNRKVFDVINRSNFATQFYEVALEILIGTGTLKIDEVDDPEMPVVFHALPQKGVAFEEGPNGNIETHWRRFKVCARNLERMWKGFKPSREIQDLINRDPDAKVDVSEGLIYEPKNKEYHGVVWVKGEDSPSWHENFKQSSPFVTGRYTKVAGEIRGRGPALQCLPDVKSLNKVKEFSLQKAAIDLAGMWTATDDGVVNPYNITIAPGVVLPVGSNNSANPSLMRMDTGTNLQLAEFQITELQQGIKRALFNDLRDPNGPVRSATEVAIEAREIAKRIGSAYGRLQTEVLIPIIKRVVFILTKRGEIQPIELDGKEIEIKFTSPLATAQDMDDLMAVQQAIEFTMATAGEERAQMCFKLEDVGTYAARKTGMDASLVRSQQEKEAVIQAGAQARQEGLMQENPVARQQEPLRSIK